MKRLTNQLCVAWPTWPANYLKIHIHKLGRDKIKQLFTGKNWRKRDETDHLIWQLQQTKELMRRLVRSNTRAARARN
ncbi:hypothetical protein RHGRI_011972 [Rhododendron griersonianum]|uniref:Ribosomal protein S15 n=1 Tax=Rhododendron griersonianum TaxID=479676 RepID=A0AAV6KNS8_9ERIC|nr:hypothetical protein RHGRI_011972 [Rhododendron griersonianum]